MSSKKAFQFFLHSGGTGKTTTVAIQRIRVKKDDEPWFSIPKELQDLQHHQEVCKLRPMETAISTLKVNRGKVRTVNVSLEEELEELYLDEDENYVFRGIALGECEYEDEGPSTDVSILADSIRHLQQRDETVSDIIKRLLIEKFSTKSKKCRLVVSLFRGRVS